MSSSVNLEIARVLSPYCIVERESPDEKRVFDSGITIYLPETQRYDSRVVTIRCTYSKRTFSSRVERQFPLQPGQQALVLVFDGEIVDHANPNVIKVHEGEIICAYLEGEQEGVHDKERNKTFSPLQNYVLVELEDTEEKSAGGIILPDTSRARNKSLKGSVVAAGPGALSTEGEYKPMEVSTGDLVVIEKYTGIDITINEKKHKLLKDTEIAALRQISG